MYSASITRTHTHDCIELRRLKNNLETWLQKY
jgi:hypothetical protein